MPSQPTIVITGATSGLGRLVAIELAAQDARLALTAWDRAGRSRVVTRPPGNDTGTQAGLWRHTEELLNGSHFA